MKDRPASGLPSCKELPFLLSPSPKIHMEGMCHAATALGAPRTRGPLLPSLPVPAQTPCRPPHAPDAALILAFSPADTALPRTSLQKMF